MRNMSFSMTTEHMEAHSKVLILRLAEISVFLEHLALNLNRRVDHLQEIVDAIAKPRST